MFRATCFIESPLEGQLPWRITLTLQEHSINFCCIKSLRLRAIYSCSIAYPILIQEDWNRNHHKICMASVTLSHKVPDPAVSDLVLPDWLVS